ncbi:F0F1 ATP synthase subunit delta [Paenibacillus apiarius]|uniref:ATP synthase subunit delta n=1 Tax=Paenibacillus apiarius TaxID=46240 RepID=A0ABT4DUA8_9BACL|nr:F0F1 ATP synthase subunit delta [Paenibacillus apiarius]MBN3523929.1 F0F1 ATP synthase subunit delta [Paenibacillus apiarius]MCY9514242.1 F0F1 ATP synthase subunit delta [Paenibacillus apiarius]MCY9520365.1 F0F1 ATP synthase subunit delta [Paenibacillus apiarius]MCY9554738.1 F0F1 ATP synthase subunit delta [Paenibacillus apiarius]MCY9557355.1 F0F1 ATP synthase subunit delta [Paenibacillus apiarius]
MSQEIGIAKRYARALFELAEERKSISETEQQLKEAAQLVSGNEKLHVLLTSPNVVLADKIGVLDIALKEQVSDIVFNTLQLLIERGRINILHEVVDSYIRIAGEAIGLLDAYVTTAYPLNETEKQAVAAEFGQKLGKTIRIQNEVDASIIGGMLVRIGDRLYDGSLSGKLKRLNKTLKSQA